MRGIEQAPFQEQAFAPRARALRYFLGLPATNAGDMRAIGRALRNALAPVLPTRPELWRAALIVAAGYGARLLAGPQAGLAQGPGDIMPLGSSFGMLSLMGVVVLLPRWNQLPGAGWIGKAMQALGWRQKKQPLTLAQAMHQVRKWEKQLREWKRQLSAAEQAFDQQRARQVADIRTFQRSQRLKDRLAPKLARLLENTEPRVHRPAERLIRRFMLRDFADDPQLLTHLLNIIDGIRERCNQLQQSLQQVPVSQRLLHSVAFDAKSEADRANLLIRLYDELAQQIEQDEPRNYWQLAYEVLSWKEMEYRGVSVEMSNAIQEIFAQRRREQPELHKEMVFILKGEDPAAWEPGVPRYSYQQHGTTPAFWRESEDELAQLTRDFSDPHAPPKIRGLQMAGIPGGAGVGGGRAAGADHARGEHSTAHAAQEPGRAAYRHERLGASAAIYRRAEELLSAVRARDPVWEELASYKAQLGPEKARQEYTAAVRAYREGTYASFTPQQLWENIDDWLDIFDNKMTALWGNLQTFQNSGALLEEETKRLTLEAGRAVFALHLLQERFLAQEAVALAYGDVPARSIELTRTTDLGAGYTGYLVKVGDNQTATVLLHPDGTIQVFKAEPEDEIRMVELLYAGGERTLPGTTPGQKRAIRNVLGTPMMKSYLAAHGIHLEPQDEVQWDQATGEVRVYRRIGFEGRRHRVATIYRGFQEPDFFEYNPNTVAGELICARVRRLSDPDKMIQIRLTPHGYRVYTEAQNPDALPTPPPALTFKLEDKIHFPDVHVTYFQRQTFDTSAIRGRDVYNVIAQLTADQGGQLYHDNVEEPAMAAVHARFTTDHAYRMIVYPLPARSGADILPRGTPVSAWLDAENPDRLAQAFNGHGAFLGVVELRRDASTGHVHASARSPSGFSELRDGDTPLQVVVEDDTLHVRRVGSTSDYGQAELLLYVPVNESRPLWPAMNDWRVVNPISGRGRYKVIPRGAGGAWVVPAEVTLTRATDLLSAPWRVSPEELELPIAGRVRVTVDRTGRLTPSNRMSSILYASPRALRGTPAPVSLGEKSEPTEQRSAALDQPAPAPAAARREELHPWQRLDEASFAQVRQERKQREAENQLELLFSQGVHAFYVGLRNVFRSIDPVSERMLQIKGLSGATLGALLAEQTWDGYEPERARLFALGEQLRQVRDRYEAASLGVTSVANQQERILIAGRLRYLDALLQVLAPKDPHPTTPPNPVGVTQIAMVREGVGRFVANLIHQTGIRGIQRVRIVGSYAKEGSRRDTVGEK